MDTSNGPQTSPVTVPLALAIALFGSIFSAVGLCICSAFWRRRRIRKQLMGADGIATTTGNITSKWIRSSRSEHGTSTSTYLVSYNFTAQIDGKAMHIYVNDSAVDGNAWERFAPPCTATVRFLEREPRRCVLQDSAEIELRQNCSLLGITCLSSVFILVGAAISFGVSLGLGVDVAAKAAGAGVFATFTAAVLILVCRALSMRVHAVICCLAGFKCCTEFNNVTVSASPQAQVVVAPAQPVIVRAVEVSAAAGHPQPVVAMAPVVVQGAPMGSPV